MRFSTRIKPISYVKAHTSELLERIEEEREPIIITQNSEAKVVLMDISSFDQMQETSALLKLLGMAEKEIEAGETFSADEILAEFRRETASR